MWDTQFRDASQNRLEKGWGWGSPGWAGKVSEASGLHNYISEVTVAGGNLLSSNMSDILLQLHNAHKYYSQNLLETPLRGTPGFSEVTSA